MAGAVIAGAVIAGAVMERAAKEELWSGCRGTGSHRGAGERRPALRGSDPSWALRRGIPAWQSTGQGPWATSAGEGTGRGHRANPPSKTAGQTRCTSGSGGALGTLEEAAGHGQSGLRCSGDAQHMGTQAGGKRSASD